MTGVGAYVSSLINPAFFWALWPKKLDYLQECMQTNLCFFGLEIEGQIAVLASSEMEQAAGHVEMTDFITLPEYRGRGIATLILQAMEQDMKKRNYWTAFSIARTGSPGINSVFAGLCIPGAFSAEYSLQRDA